MRSPQSTSLAHNLRLTCDDGELQNPENKWQARGHHVDSAESGIFLSVMGVIKPRVGQQARVLTLSCRREWEVSAGGV